MNVAENASAAATHNTGTNKRVRHSRKFGMLLCFRRRRGKKTNRFVMTSSAMCAVVVAQKKPFVPRNDMCNRTCLLTLLNSTPCVILLWIGMVSGIVAVPVGIIVGESSANLENIGWGLIIGGFVLAVCVGCFMCVAAACVQQPARHVDIEEGCVVPLLVETTSELSAK
jgi:hypothetical protein